jgi:hypothetical protein
VICGRRGSNIYIIPAALAPIERAGTPVPSVLPDFVLRELGAAPMSSEGYFFWIGKF